MGADDEFEEGLSANTVSPCVTPLVNLKFNFFASQSTLYTQWSLNQ